VLGEPVQVGERTVVPVVKISLGFGGGGNDVSAENKNVSGGGGGGGFSISPIGFIVIEGEKTSFLPVKTKNVTALTEMIPEIIEKITSRKKGEQTEQE